MKNKVVIYKAFCSAFIPLTATFAASLTVLQKDVPENWKLWVIFGAIVSNALNASASGLSNFLSRTFADYHNGVQNENKTGNP